MPPSLQCRYDTKWNRLRASKHNLFYSTLFALIPKCGMCWAAWISVFTSAGLTSSVWWNSFVAYYPLIIAVAFVLLVVHLGLLVYRCYTIQDYFPLLTTLIGFGLIALDRYMLMTHWVAFIGIVFCSGMVWKPAFLKVSAQ